MGRARYFVVTPQRTLERAKGLTEALSSRREGAFLWFDFPDPDPTELSALVEPLGLHPLAIEDCLDEDQVPKMDGFEGNTFILFNRYRSDDAEATVEELNFFIGTDFLVTVHSHGVVDGELATRLEATVRRDAAHALRGPDFLLQVIMDDVVDEKFGAVEALQEQLDDIEDGLLRTPAGFDPSGLVLLRRTLLHLRKSLVYEREILVKMCRRDSPYITEESIYGFRDIYDHLARFFEVVEICRELISSTMEIHLSMVNNQMTMVANRTNQVVRRLTLITTVFMPLTLLAGIGGMSEWSMMTGPSNWPIAYPSFLLGMVVIGLLNYLLLRRSESADRPSALPYTVACTAGEVSSGAPEPPAAERRRRRD